jgi:hypothetical protein
MMVRVVESMKRQGDLFEVVDALRTRSGLTYPSGCGNQQCNRDRDDGQDDE